MRNGLPILCAWLCLLPASLPAQEADAVSVSLQVLETDPGIDATLHHDEAFYLRIGYVSNKPLRIFARPFNGGETAGSGAWGASHPARWLPAGEGETLGWFAYRGYANVDEVRITAVEPRTHQEYAAISVPVTLYWDDARTAARPRAAWVAELNARQQQAQSEPVEPESGDLMLGQIIIVALFACIIGALIWAMWGWLQWPGGWKLLAGVPLAVLGLWVLSIIVSVAGDPTARNLWPLELFMWAAGTLVYMLVVTILKRTKGN